MESKSYKARKGFRDLMQCTICLLNGAFIVIPDRPDQGGGSVDAIVNDFSESCSPRVFGLAIGLPEVSVTFLFFGVCQDEHGPVCHWVAPPGPVGIQNSDNRRPLFAMPDEEIERPQISVQQAWDLNFIQLL